MLLFRNKNNDSIDDNDDDDDDVDGHNHNDVDDDDDYMSEMKITINSKEIDQSIISRENLINMKRQFPDLDYDTLSRYLIAQKDNPFKACAQLRKTMKLREKYWGINHHHCLHEISSGKCFFAGFDKERRPVLVINARLHHVQRRDLMESVLMTLWWMEYAIAKLPPNMSRITILIDRVGCDNIPLDRELIQTLAGIFQDLHPERLHRAIIYPAGVVFYTMWNTIMKWLLQPSTRDKIVPALSVSEVTYYINESVIPTHMVSVHTH